MDQHKPSSIDLLEQVTAHMRANGVRRVRIARGELELEVELDPASQYLGDKSETESSPPPEEKPEGTCGEPRCDAKGGHLGTAYCRAHFQKALNGQ